MRLSRLLVCYLLVCIVNPIALNIEAQGRRPSELFPACLRDKCGYINATGKFLIKPKYNQAEDFSEGLAAVQINDKWGYINSSGQVIIQPRFDAAEPFSGSLARIRFNEQLGYFLVGAFHT